MSLFDAGHVGGGVHPSCPTIHTTVSTRTSRFPVRPRRGAVNEKGRNDSASDAVACRALRSFSLHLSLSLSLSLSLLPFLFSEYGS